MKAKREKYLALMFAFFLIFILYFCNQKDYFDGDEMFSYSLANGYYTPFLRWNNDWWNTWHPIQYLTDQLTVGKGEGFQYASVIYNQSQDVHPPFYYMILHTLCSLFPNTFTKWIGLGLNIILYMLSGFLVYLITAIISDENFYLSLGSTLAYMLCAMTISDAIYIRMYMLATVLVLVDVYINISKDMITWKNSILLGFLTFIGGVTHYYYAIVAGIISFLVIILMLIDKRIKDAILYACFRIIGVVMIFVLYPAAKKQVFSGSRSITSKFGTMSDRKAFFEQLNYYWEQLGTKIYGYKEVFTVLVAMILFFLVGATFSAYKHKKMVCLNKKLVLVFLVQLLFFCFCVIYCPKVSFRQRYFYIVSPLIICSNYVLVNKLIKFELKEQFSHMMAVIACSVLIITSLISVKDMKNIDYLHFDRQDVYEMVCEKGCNSHFFVNKGDSQEYSFWMQYINLARDDNNYFCVTTVDRLDNLSDSELQEIMLPFADDGILVYIITSYNTETATEMAKDIGMRIGLESCEYILTTNGERIFYISKG